MISQYDARGVSCIKSSYKPAFKNNKIKKYNKNNNRNLLLNICSTFAIWCFLTLTSNNGAVQGASVYSNLDVMTKPNFEPICSVQQERFIESDGKESSLILEFNSGVATEKRKSCTRILSAPLNYGFIVRLILPKIKYSTHRNQIKMTASETNENGKAKKSTALSGMASLFEKLNSTVLKSMHGRSCPLNIFSSLDPHTPQWRIDPCQLEDTAPEMEDPVRLFHGRVRIVWEHGHQLLRSKLMVTTLGKGDQCRGDSKHQCLKIGDEPILCISKELVCDGIRHCPYSIEYDSDEDYEMCWQHRRYGEPLPPAIETDIFEHFALEVFRNLFAFDVPTIADAAVEDDDGEVIMATPIPLVPTNAAAGTTQSIANRTTLRKVHTKSMDDDDENTVKLTLDIASNTTEIVRTVKLQQNNTTETTTTENVNFGSAHHRHRNSTRSGLSSDLSKYGPWGYLMLGMLLCGGALLICGLWASASQHAANNERESSVQNSTGGEHQSSYTSPPNYEELDPPPAYSVLFPNQKADSSTTLSSLANGMQVDAAAATSSSIASGSAAVIGAHNSAASTNTATTTSMSPLEVTLIPHQTCNSSAACI